MAQPIEEMAAHVERLCRDHEIQVRWNDSYYRRGLAHRKRRWVQLQRITTQQRYAVALHEIGHVVGRWQSRCRLEQEAGAWQYAMDTSLTDWTTATWVMARRYLQGYLTKATMSLSWGVPQSSSPFWRVLRVIEDRAGDGRRCSDSPSWYREENERHKRARRAVNEQRARLRAERWPAA